MATVCPGSVPHPCSDTCGSGFCCVWLVFYSFCSKLPQIFCLKVEQSGYVAAMPGSKSQSEKVHYAVSLALVPNKESPSLPAPHGAHRVLSSRSHFSVFKLSCAAALWLPCSSHNSFSSSSALSVSRDLCDPGKPPGLAKRIPTSRPRSLT